MAGVTLKETAAASVPTPATDKATIFLDSADGLPKYKDDAGTTHSLKDATGTGDVVGPASSTDGHVAVFDGTDGKKIKDGGAPAVDRNVVTALSISSGNVAVDCSLGDYFTLALNANVTSWSITNVPPGCSLMIEITQDSTARTVAWPTGTKWVGGTAGAVSTGSGAKDVLALTTFNTGSTWRATLAKAFA